MYQFDVIYHRIRQSTDRKIEESTDHSNLYSREMKRSYECILQKSQKILIIQIQAELRNQFSSIILKNQENS